MRVGLRMQAFCGPFLCLVRCSRWIQRAVLSSPDSPVIGHASGGPVLVKEGKVNWVGRRGLSGSYRDGSLQPNA